MRLEIHPLVKDSFDANRLTDLAVEHDVGADNEAAIPVEFGTAPLSLCRMFGDPVNSAPE